VPFDADQSWTTIEANAAALKEQTGCRRCLVG
jgi:hypothetical protein